MAKHEARQPFERYVIHSAFPMQIYYWNAGIYTRYYKFSSIKLCLLSKLYRRRRSKNGDSTFMNYDVLCDKHKISKTIFQNIYSALNSFEKFRPSRCIIYYKFEEKGPRSIKVLIYLFKDHHYTATLERNPSFFNPSEYRHTNNKLAEKHRRVVQAREQYKRRVALIFTSPPPPPSREHQLHR